MRRIFKYTLSMLVTSTLAMAQEIIPEDLYQNPPQNIMNESIQYNFWDEFGKMSLALSLILISLFILAWALKRVMGKRNIWMNESSIIKILERRPLSPKASLYLLEVEGKKILIGESPNGISRISDVTPKADFQSMLKQ